MDDRRFRGVLLSCGAAAVFVAAGLIGRASVVAGGGPFSLVWPAAGVAVVWFLSRPGRVARAVDLLLLCIADALVAAISGAPARVLPVVVGSAVLGTVSTVVVLGRLDPSLTGGVPGVRPLRTPRSVVRFALVSAFGCAVGVAAGALGLEVLDGTPAPAIIPLWWGRNVCGVLAVGVPGLLLVDHLRHRPRPRLLPGSALPEIAALLLVTVALTVADGTTSLPLTFLLPAVTVWAGSRFPPLVVALHALLGGAATIWLTLHEHGPFGEVEPVRSAALLAQVFVAMTLVMGLLLAAAREANLALEAERVQRANEQREDLIGFARRAAHDLQGPLAVIDGWSTELAVAIHEDALAPASGAPMMVAKVRAATQQARELVSDILADAIAQDRAPARDRVDLTQLVQQLVRSGRWAADVDVGEVGVVRGDATLLQQLFANLIDNAAKYVQPDETPRVTITGDVVDDEVRVRVADLGPGIPAGQHERIFGEFERASQEHGGTGLGLSICRRIAERHGGRIRASDRDDGRDGAVFEIALPAWTDPLRPTARADRATPSPRLTEVTT